MRPEATTEPDSALAGIRVLDFTHALAGPYCTLLLADFGASVFKVEGVTGGDMGRGWGPPFAGEQSSFFMGLNRGKQGIAIDLKRPEGLDLCLRLMDRMDVLIENFRPGTMDRLGLGYSDAAARNPGLVYCSISGYGQQGPLRDAAAMDLIIECSSGFLSITGTEAGETVRSGYAVADVNAGMFASIGILMALRARERTGRGQYVDVSMLDSMISAMSSNYMTFLGSGKVPGPMGNAFLTVVPYAVFEARDGRFSIAVGSEKLWSQFCQAIERGDLEAHPDFATNARRVENRHALHGILNAVFRGSGVSEWMDRLGAAGIPCSPVLNLAEVVAHPQAAAREMFPTVGSHRVTGPPLKLSETPARIQAGAPRLGEHTVCVLADVLGLDAGAIEDLRLAGIIAAPGS
jgi:crotonobetainyl-CoA:carnitine CoA-transferase CaiB-like acyl-CoA transferase